MRTNTSKLVSKSGSRSTPQTAIGPLWTRKQVADALGLGVPSVYRYTKRGLLPCIVINRRVVRYDPQAVQAFIDSAKGGVR
jgi:predicted DNA-binding transcriptional regulator AlpA